MFSLATGVWRRLAALTLASCALGVTNNTLKVSQVFGVIFPVINKKRQTNMITENIFHSRADYAHLGNISGYLERRNKKGQLVASIDT